MRKYLPSHWAVVRNGGDVKTKRCGGGSANSDNVAICQFPIGSLNLLFAYVDSNGVQIVNGAKGIYRKELFRKKEIKSISEDIFPIVFA
jgi:hypothetical protein